MEPNWNGLAEVLDPGLLENWNGDEVSGTGLFLGSSEIELNEKGEGEGAGILSGRLLNSDDFMGSKTGTCGWASCSFLSGSNSLFGSNTVS